MSKKITALSLLTAVSVLAISSNASAIGFNGITPYVSGNVQYLIGQDDEASDGNSSSKINNKDGFGLGAAVGIKINNFRQELEFSYLDNEVKGFDSSPVSGIGTSLYNYMANTYYDFRNTSAFTPYLGGGIGVAHGKFYDSESNTAGTANAFAYQAMAGVGYEIDKNNTVYLGYRYIGTTFDKDSVEYSYERNSLEAGYRFSF